MNAHITLADDCERVLRHIADFGPLSIDELTEKTGLRVGAINASLCQLNLGGMVTPVVTRKGRVKVTRYALKEKQR